MKIFRILLLLLFAVSIKAVWVDADGSGIGEIDVSNDPAYYSYIPSIAVDSRGNPHIAWYSNDPSGNLEIYYLYWNGVQWVDVTGSAGQEAKNVSLNSTSSEYPMLVLDSFDRPHIVWEDGASGDREVYYLYWNGSDWVDAAGTGRVNIDVSNMTGYSGHPVIALSSAGLPGIAWAQQDGADFTKSDIYYAQYNGSIWTGAVTGLPEKVYESAYASLSPFLCLDSMNRPHITWSDGPDTNREIYYLKFDGSAWVDATGMGISRINISNTPLYSAWPKMDLDSSDRPHIVWEDDDEGGQNIYYLHWNGSQWVDVDGAGIDKINVSGTYHYASVPGIKLDQAGAPHVMWGEGAIETCDIMCEKWNGLAWTDETGSGSAYKRVYHDDLNSEWASFALDSRGTPHIVWSDGEVYQEHDIFYLHWQPDGTPTITPTYKPGDTPYPTLTPTKTITATLTITATYTITPVPVPIINPNPCWTDADGNGAENDPVNSGIKPVLKLDSSGHPHMAWVNNGKLYYMKWNGFSWTDADGSGLESIKISGTIFGSDSPDMVLDGSDRPHIAWTGFQTGCTYIYYLSWNGSQWVDVNGSDIQHVSVPIVQGGYAADVSLALDSLQQPNLAWSDYPDSLTYSVKDIFFYRWNGLDWVDSTGMGRALGRVTGSASDCTKPSLKLDGSGIPYIAYLYGSSKVRYLKLNSAGAWVDAGGTGISYIDAILNPGVTAARQPGLHLDSLGFPSISFPCTIGSLSYPCFLKWDGTQWTDADGTGQGEINLPTLSNVLSVSMAYDSLGNPSIAWTAIDGLYFMKYNGSAWVDADGTGVESVFVLPFLNNGNKVSLALDSNNSPAVAWDDYYENYYLSYICGPPAHTFTASPTPTATPTNTPTPTISASHTVSPTQTVSVSPTVMPVLVTIKKKAAANPGTMEVIYTITIKNDPLKNVYNITLWDTLSDQLEYIDSISGPVPQVTGQYIFWDWGGGIVNPDEEIKVSFKAKIRNPSPEMLVANTAATDYNDDYYAVDRHPAVFSNQAFYPEGRLALYPNPFNPDTAIGGKLKFVNMPANSFVSIYTLSGEFVVTANTENTNAYWDGKNRGGSKVSSGIYLYAVRNSNSANYLFRGKIYLIRNRY